jgi:hypothetical protein
MLISTALAATACAGQEQGYLGQGSNWVDFVQWTQNGSSLTGSITSAELDGTSVKSNRAAFTGVVNAKQVTLTFPQGFGVVTNLSGSLNGTALDLDVPQPDGTIATVEFSPGAVTDYNKAVLALQDRAAQQRAQAAQQQAQQEAQQQAQQAADQQARREADARNAVDQGVSAVNGDVNSLTHDVGSFQSLSSAVDADLKQAYKDTVATYQALQQVQSEGHGSLGCGVDATTVGVDATSVGVDETSVGVDQTSEQIDVQSVNRDIATVDADFQSLQAAEKAVPSYQPSNPPTADQVAQAGKQARTANAQADAMIAAALKQAKGWVDQANAYAKAAQAVCA